MVFISPRPPRTKSWSLFNSVPFSRRLVSASSFPLPPSFPPLPTRSTQFRPHTVQPSRPSERARCQLDPDFSASGWEQIFATWAGLEIQRDTTLLIIAADRGVQRESGGISVLSPGACLDSWFHSSWLVTPIRRGGGFTYKQF